MLRVDYYVLLKQREKPKNHPKKVKHNRNKPIDKLIWQNIYKQHIQPLEKPINNAAYRKQTTKSQNFNHIKHHD